jgi:putative peptidoglycan lipid II flippase
MSLAKSTTVVGGNTLASRVLGFARDVVFARLFGAGAGMDVFVVAFQIPNFLRRLFAEGAFSQAFVPVLSEYQARGPHAEVKALADRVAGTLGVLLFLVTLLGIVAAPCSFCCSPRAFRRRRPLALASEMLRLTFPYLFFIS